MYAEIPIQSHWYFDQENDSKEGKCCTSPKNKITARCRNRNVSPIRSRPECNRRRLQVFTAWSSLTTDRELTKKMVTTRTKDVWNVNPIAFRPGPSSCKEENAVGVPETNVDDEFLMDSKDVSSTHVEV